jgi:hypothetical protein
VEVPWKERIEKGGNVRTIVQSLSSSPPDTKPTPLCLVHFMTAQFLSVHLQPVMADKITRRRDMVRGRGL